MKDIKNKREVYILMIFVLAMAIAFLFIKPILTGYISITETYNYTDVLDLSYNKSSEYTWMLENEGNLKSVSINAKFIDKGNGSAKVYLRYNDTAYLIFDSLRLEEGLGKITGYAVLNVSETNISSDIQNLTVLNETEVNESLVNESINQSLDNESIVNESVYNQTIENLSLSKIIDLRLEFYNESEYDTDNDGIEEIDGVIDLTVKNTEFNFDANPELLCTRWGINNVNDICYGNSDCCNFLDLSSSSPNWNDPYYSYLEKDGASYNNTISAQVVYFFYNLTKLEAEVVYSNVSNLNVLFSTPYIEFRDICLETCLLPEFNASSYTLIFEVNNSILDIESISYAIEKEIIKNNPPELVKDILNISIVKNGNYTINLSNYFSDEDTLTYSYYETENISVIIDNNVALIVPDKDFSGIRSSFFIANDSKSIAVSNMFKINVSEGVEEYITETLVQGKAEINKPVRWVKRIRLKQPSGNLSVSISKDAFNISVNKIIIYPNRTSNLIINHSSEGEYEIEYYTPAPVSVERVIGDKREILVKAEVNYTNVLVYTDIKDNLYWLSNKRDLIYLLDNNISYRSYGDSLSIVNKTRLEDYISFKHPEFSEIEYKGIIDYNATKDHATLNVTIDNKDFKLIFRLDDNKDFFNKEYNITTELDTIDKIEEYFKSNDELEIELNEAKVSNLLNLTFSEGKVYWIVPYLPSRFVIR